jgi:putative phosphoesterase
MNIGVISDTHIPYRANSLPDIVLQYFKDVGHIFHSGDIADIDVIQTLEKFAPVTAVAGNIDPPELRELLGEKKLITLGGFRFGIVHGQGSKGKTIDQAAGAFSGTNADCIVFGHSHIPFCGYHGNTLLFNPGSPTDKRRNKYYSFGMIEVNETILPRIIYFSAAGDVISASNV